LAVIQTIIGGGKEKLASEAFKSLYQLQQYKRVCDEILGQVDILLTPTTGTIYTIDEVNADPIKMNSNLGYYTNYMNLLDYSAIALPSGFMSNGLPWGISMVAPVFADRQLLSFGRQWQQAMELTMGKTENHFQPAELTGILQGSDFIDVVVCGAHLQGFPLNWQLTERGSEFVQATQTTSSYRFYALAGDGVKRPGLVRDEQSGKAIDVEVWRVPASEFGSFVAGIPAPLGIGKVELADGQWLTGFICEPYALEDAEEISQFGGWANYLESSK
jgi:allophanate hydrolase